MDEKSKFQMVGLLDKDQMGELFRFGLVRHLDRDLTDE